MSKYKYIRADVYRRGITIFIGPRKELFKFVEEVYKDNKKLIENVKDTIDSEALGTTFTEDDGQSLIWIPKFPKTPSEIAILGHEVLHATFILLDYCNVEYIHNDSNEPYTYLFEYFMEQALITEGYEKV